MRILGIDPGLSHLGYGVIVHEQGRLSFVDAGTISTDADESLGARLMVLHHAVCDLIQLHRPDIVALERQIFCQNVQTAMTLGQVQGVVTLAAEEHDLEVWTATPRELKMALAGRGQATKEQVATSVRLLLALRVANLPEHATDALAAAIAYSNRSAIRNRLSQIELLASRRRR